MTNVNKLVSDLINDLETIAKDIVDGIKETVPTKEEPTAPEAEESDWLDDEEFAYLAVGDEVQPAWEAVEALREAETAADDGDHEKANSYIAIADRYIRLADIFKETEVTVSLR